MSASSFASWNSEIKIDEMTDTEFGFMMEKSVKGRSMHGKPYTAIVECWPSEKKQLDIFISWGEVLYFTSLPEIIFRFDKDEMFKIKVKRSINGFTTKITNQKDILRILNNMLTKKVMRVKVSDYHNISLAAGVFHLQGFDNSFKQVCGHWLK